MTYRFRSLFVVFIVALSAFLAGCGGPQIERTVFTVEGMHCESCSSAIVGSMEKVDGVVLAAADYELGRAEVTYRSDSVTPEQLKAEIEELGYTVTGATSEKAEG